MYLFKKLIFAEHNLKKSIYVYENYFYRWLCFDNNYVQTIVVKKKPYKPVLKYIPSLCLNLNLESQKAISDNKVLMLGSGGGAIFHYINYYHKDSSLLMVDHEELIIDIAKQYFKVEQDIIKADAFKYIKKADKVNNILIDIFIDQNIPMLMQKPNFLEECKLKASICVSFNLVSQNKNQVLETIKIVQNVFKNKTLILYIKNKSNIIIHAYTNNNYLNIIKELSITNIITKPKWQEHYGLVATLK